MYFKNYVSLKFPSDALVLLPERTIATYCCTYHLEYQRATEALIQSLNTPPVLGFIYIHKHLNLLHWRGKFIKGNKTKFSGNTCSQNSGFVICIGFQRWGEFMDETVWFYFDLHWCNTYYLTHKLKFCQYDTSLYPQRPVYTSQNTKDSSSTFNNNKQNHWGSKCSTAEGKILMLIISRYRYRY